MNARTGGFPRLKLRFANPLGRWGAMALLLALAIGAGARGEDETIPKGGADEISFQFLPPPLDDARYSIGVFDAKGKLVRRLHEGALESFFPAALNGLIVRWNAKDDAGKRAPNGKYTLRGYAVGPLKITGVATLGNDWLADDPVLRITTIMTILPHNGGFRALAQLADGREAWILYPKGGYSGTTNNVPATDPTDTPDRGWRVASGRLIQEKDGKVLRSWQPAAGDPEVVAVAAPEDGRIFLLERLPNKSWERVRGIELGADESNPEWKTFFVRNIRVPEKFEAADAGPTLRADLVKNPLASKRSGAPTLTLQAIYDPKGSYLGTTEGLRLRQVSQVKNLKSVAMAKGSGKGSVRFFQRDGAASEEFLIEGVDHIMALDVGGCEINERGEVLPAPEKDN